MRTTVFDDRGMFELTSRAAGFNGVSRSLVALNVSENDHREMKSVDEVVVLLQAK